MRMTALYRSFFALDRPERWHAVEAAALLCAVWGGLRVLRFGTLRRLLARYARAFAAPPAWPLREAVRPSVQRVVAGLGARLPVARNCLVQALATVAMLRRHGLPADLSIGVRKTDAPALEAHAWVVSEGTIVVGDIEHLSDFSPLTG
jgi:hypothetical protein